MKGRVRGLYILILSLPKPQTITVGKLASKRFEEGLYFYIGKARNGLKGRIDRHFREKKSLRWHIDYFLKKADILEVWTRPDFYDECGTARKIRSTLGEFSLPLKNFGSSDCRCPGHFFFAPGEKLSLARLRETLNFKKVKTHGHNS